MTGLQRSVRPAPPTWLQPRPVGARRALPTALVVGVTASAAFAHGAALLRPVGWTVALIGVCVASNVVSARHPGAGSAAVVAVACLIVVTGTSNGDLFDRLHGPFGYSNATAAFFVVVVGAVLVWRTSVRQRAYRHALAVAAVVAAAVPALVHSRAGAVLVLLPLATLLPGWCTTAPRRAARLGALSLVAAAAGVLATARLAPGLPARLGFHVPSLSPSITERVRLWGEALALVREAPLTGVGPGRFGAAGVPARAPWEHYAHNEYLQVAAELGVPALLLALGGSWWVMRRIAHGSTPAALPALAMATALGLHAALDYILHFPAVIFAGAAVLGSALPSPGSAVEPKARRSTDDVS